MSLHSPSSLLHFWGETCLNILYYHLLILTCDSITLSFYHLTVTKRHSTIINNDQAACLDYSAIGLTNPSPRINSGMIENCNNIRLTCELGLSRHKVWLYKDALLHVGLILYHYTTVIVVQTIVINYIQKPMYSHQLLLTQNIFKLNMFQVLLA